MELTRFRRLVRHSEEEEHKQVQAVLDGTDLVREELDTYEQTFAQIPAREEEGYWAEYVNWQSLLGICATRLAAALIGGVGLPVTLEKIIDLVGAQAVEQALATWKERQAEMDKLNELGELEDHPF